MRLSLLLLIFFIALPVSLSAEELQEGKAYQRILPKVPKESGDKPEVVELFWYGCPHCYSMEAPLNNWLKTKSPQVVFRRIPAVFSPAWGFHAQVFYTAEALDIIDKIHTPLFERVHELKQPMNDLESIAKFFAEFGIERKKFDDTWNSFAVKTKVNRARELSRRYQIDSVPSFVVNGEFRTDTGMNGNSNTKTVHLIDLLSKK